MAKPILLIGMMGCGKSTLGQMLASGWAGRLLTWTGKLSGAKEGAFPISLPRRTTRGSENMKRRLSLTRFARTT